jgi:beta-glucanase (GH16 family)
MNRALQVFFLTCISLMWVGCGENEPEKKVENLVISVEVPTDGTGEVAIIANADNAKYFKFFFGDVDNETPVQQEFGSILHTYEESGVYTIKVQAHLNEADFIFETEDIEIELFIAVPTTGYTTPATYANMNLIWQDEFDGIEINPSKWTFEIGDGCPNVCGWGNNELEYYRQENASIYGGNLMIEARSEAFGAKSYTSTRMITKGKFDFKYGRVDIRAALPEGKGVWPALWMLGANIDTEGWPKCGEIDIMEKIGGGIEEKRVHGTVHWFADAYANYGGSFTGSTEGIFNDKFHVFSITWDAEFIRWYVDDVKFHEIDIRPSHLSEFRENFFLILNVAVGGNWPGSPDSSTKFPQRMFVDYIRVFQPQ